MSEALLGSELDAMVTRYLEELNDALRRLPTSQRDHLISEIREHIVEMRAERPPRDRSDMEALLNRVGLPEDIAAVALDGVEDLQDPVPLVADTPDAAPSSWATLRGRMSKRVVLAGSAAAIVVVGLSVGLIASNGDSRQLAFAIPRGASRLGPIQIQPPQSIFWVTVPNVIGDTTAEAGATLGDAGLTYTVVYTPSATVPAGVVNSQDPPSGSISSPKQRVVITVSSGPESTTS
jgi:hypothetical protein